MLYDETNIETDIIYKMAEKILEECESYDGESISFEGKNN